MFIFTLCGYLSVHLSAVVRVHCVGSGAKGLGKRECTFFHALWGKSNSGSFQVSLAGGKKKNLERNEIEVWIDRDGVRRGALCISRYGNFFLFWGGRERERRGRQAYNEERCMPSKY